jgi:tRNA-dihydrouridine synthase
LFHRNPQIVKDFSSAAQRAKTGGIDGIEIKCDQGFLLHQFLSPHYNRRSDEYGGDFKKRLKLIVEILEATRDKVGKEFIIGIRISGDSLSPDDISQDESIKASQFLAKTKLLDYIHVNGATNSTYIGYLISHGDGSIEERNFTHLSKRIKCVVDIPVIVTSMVSTPQDAEFVVRNDFADMVAMTRAHITDPEVVNKTRENRLDDIRPCIRCNQECVGGHHFGKPVRCIYNPATGREKELGIGTIKKTSTTKSILIIGGGVSGMETARIAALRGHEVHLLEKQNQLGGQLLYAGQLPFMQGLIDVSRYLEKQLKKLKVNIYLGNEVTKENYRAILDGIDITILATGSTPEIPQNYQQVASENAFTPIDMINNEKNLGENILVVDVNWRQNPLAISEWLYQRGHNVIIISSEYFVGEGINIASRTSYYKRLLGKVKFLPLTEFISHKDGVAEVRNVITNKHHQITPINQIVFSCGFLPNRELFDAFQEIPKVFQVGACDIPTGISDAILKANRMARLL